MVLLLALFFLPALPAAAQQVTNKPLFFDKEGPRVLQRGDVAATQAATVRWEQRAKHAINKDNDRPGAWSEVVVAQWDAEFCAKKRGPFCAERGAWSTFKKLNAREREVSEVAADGAASGHYLIFGRSRFDPSPRSSWMLDMMIANEALEAPAGARRLVFDTSPSVGGSVRYSVVVVPVSTIGE